MNLINHDIEHERKLIEMLGFDLIGPDKYNHWNIKKNDEVVGYIQYKKYLRKTKN